MSFAEKYARVFESLYGESPSAAAAISPREIEELERDVGHRLPPALRQFYLVLGGEERVTSVHHRLTQPVDMHIEDERLIFGEEHEGVCMWGVFPGVGDDPPVFEGTTIDPVQWFETGRKCSDFLVMTMYLHAVWGGFPHIGDHMDPEEILPALETWDLVVEDNGLFVWRQGGKLVSHIDTEDFVQGAGRTAADFDELVRAFGFERH